MIGELGLILLALALGGLIKGAVGAGAPVVAVPVLVLLFDVQLAVAVMVIPNVFSNVLQGWQYRDKALPPRFTWGYAITGAVGVAVGTWVLATVPPRFLLLAVAAAVFGFIGFRIVRPHAVLSYRVAEIIVWPVGVAAGVLQGATGISAPISITFLNAMGLKRETFIGTISVFFLVISVVQIPVLWVYGLLDWQRTLYGIAAIAPLMGFMPVGNFLASKLPPKLFDRVILALLAVIAVRMIWKAFQ
ncbi:sulfite exporter TauE/SafE family protein [Psychromarinibacter sp. C21-152]|uniref:Probable membrane transporter protein n=1 Tax=Psychromarinibacter sediminicola TaxID=3033385 RepID=A0AAE3TC25_9RHOB|nr:sulfite exporter TauE/SafE family protein [Psychromarinibacter sediminicola]MDF0603489.1 sulfite exporter TauE/SafE family protein [Psychromarinibacter sediminicola]